MSASETRQAIIVAADRLFYEHGFAATSFADIAEAVGLSRGNFYYHFKTKDELLDAVIAWRREGARDRIARWEETSAAPEDRIRSFIGIVIANREKIMAHGCPLGTMSEELAKLGHQSEGDATRIFALYRAWLARQFSQLGREDEADALALHVLMRSQGIATLATAFKDEAFLRREVGDLNAWVIAQIPSNGAADLAVGPTQPQI